ncbi:MAG TPA: alpha/beta hydrolase [Candidatus Kryptonia bacterium]|nr:alpha/beta hydrolase [Candidatus Kryptonia bacterium]
MSRAELTGLFDMMRSMPPPRSIAELRVGMDAAIAFFNANPSAVGSIEVGVEIGHGVRADIIAPAGTPPFPVLIYLHGGGWSIGSPATHHKVARQLCAGAGALVVNVDYRLAPEHPFPTPLDDCVAAARWTRANVGRFGGDHTRLAIGGDSAGGNLSAAVINDLRNDIRFRAALLIYGAYDVVGCRRDYDKWAPEEDPVIPKHSMDLMIAAYLSAGASNDDPRVSPIKADLRHFPPACLLCGTWDPLIGDSRALHAKLQSLDRESVLHEYEGMPHAFVQLPCTEADLALNAGCDFLRAKFR